MDSDQQTTENIQESLVEQNKAGDMAPLETEDCESGNIDQKENRDPKQQEAVLMECDDGAWSEKDFHKMISTDGEMDDAEDGEILEDGEIASDQDGEVNDKSVTQENEEDEVRSESIKSGPSKSRSGGHRDEHGRKGHSRRERNSKRRRTSKEESHKDKQKKKSRHREPADYEKEGNEGQWPADRREKGERKRDRSPTRSYKRPRHGGEERSRYNKDSEKRRNATGDTHHHRGSKDRDGERNKDGPPHDDCVEKDRKDHERHEKDKKIFNDNESPPGIYDSPSDNEYSNSRFEDKKPLNTAGPADEGFEKPWNITGRAGEVFEKPWNTADPAGEGFEEEKPWTTAGQADEEVNEDANNESVGRNKRRQLNKRKHNFERKQHRAKETISDDFEDEQPVKKKPLLQTPMEERPICKFFKEGKCQKGSECPFNHDCQLQKRFELCKYHLQSQCRKREECVFMHEDFPCKYFHTGSTCYQGDNCKFSHDPLTPDTEMALQNSLSEREDFVEDHTFELKKNRRKGLLGDQPTLSVEEVQRKLEHIKYIPSIFDIQTHAPGDSPSKPPTSQSTNVRPQGFYLDNSMSPRAGMTGPHMRFNVPPVNQGTPPNRAPFIGPGMDGPPMGPPMVNGPGLMAPGPPPMMTVPGMQGPPMSQQAAALVGAILRAAPMLQQYRGPMPQGPMASLPNAMGGDARFLGSNMMVPITNIVQSVPVSIMSPAPVMPDGNQQNIMSHQQTVVAQASQEMVLSQLQTNTSLGQINTGGSLRDPRKMAAALNDPRLNRISQDTDMLDLGDMDMRSTGTSGNSLKENLGDEDLRQDMDFRLDDGNKGDRTPQQDWDDIEDLNGDDDNMDIPDHLPLKQRQMFLRIQQHTLKMKKEKSAQQSHVTLNKPTESQSQDDDKWYSSDDDDDNGKPNISNILQSLNQIEMKQESVMMTTPSAVSVMQMINKIKHSTPTSANCISPGRAMDPRKQMKPKEQVIIESRDGDCPWRLCKVLCVKQHIPDNVNLQDTKYKNDPRVQKMLKLHDLEIGKVIDHTKSSVPVKKEPLAIEPKLPDLLDPNIFNEKKASLAKSELTLFIDPNPVKLEFSGKPVQRFSNQRLKSGSKTNSQNANDPHFHRSSSSPGNLGQSQPTDSRMVRQDSNLGSSENSFGRSVDHRFLRQDSQEQFMGDGDSTPPLDTKILSRQTSSDPRRTKCDTLDINISVNLSRPTSVGQFNKTDADESDQQSLPRQLSQPNISVEIAATSDVTKPKLDYRNDPRFKRKPISESNLSPETLGKRSSRHQSSSVEYSSPLGVESSKVEDLGYNSYNRPRVTKPQLQLSQSPNVSAPPTTESVSVPTSDLIPRDILDSLPITALPAAGELQDKNLKDIFKTIDPTASPFC